MWITGRRGRLSWMALVGAALVTGTACMDAERDRPANPPDALFVDFANRVESYIAVRERLTDSIGDLDPTRSQEEIAARATALGNGLIAALPHLQGRERAVLILDSNYLDPEQVKWLEHEVASSDSEWKIAYFHRPLYTTARRGPEVELRAILEPIFLQHGVDVVFVGHEHVYERFKPQKGIHHFLVGGAAKLRQGDTRRGPLTAATFDRDRSFMIVEIVDNKLFFQVISRTGAVVDEGIITTRETAKATRAAVP